MDRDGRGPFATLGRSMVPYSHPTSSHSARAKTMREATRLSSSGGLSKKTSADCEGSGNLLGVGRTTSEVAICRRTQAQRGDEEGWGDTPPKPPTSVLERASVDGSALAREM